jgi:2-(1,2-epoxy-1,2-dihydrophenyl)acetyl-CoA isomerase
MPEPSASVERPLEEQILHRVEHGIASITLNRPEAQNAITPDQRDRLIDLLSEASTDIETRVVVITGTGKGFCTGADLRVSRPSAPRPEAAPDRVAGDISRMLRDGAQRLVAAILDCEKPVIAAVNGTAAGIGAHLAFASDLVIAAKGARFIEVFVRRGLVPDGGGAYLLTRLVGPQKAKELMFFGDLVTADEALAMGLVNKVVSDRDLPVVTTEWAERLAEGPTRAVSLTKWLVNRSLESDRAGAFHDEALAQELNMGTRDAQEGVRSFVERREADFKGW